MGFSGNTGIFAPSDWIALVKHAIAKRMLRKVLSNINSNNSINVKFEFKVV